MGHLYHGELLVITRGYIENTFQPACEDWHACIHVFHTQAWAQGRMGIRCIGTRMKAGYVYVFLCVMQIRSGFVIFLNLGTHIFLEVYQFIMSSEMAIWLWINTYTYHF